MANLLSLGTAFAGLFGPDAILSATGAPVTSTPVTVYQSDGTTTASLFTSQTKGSAASNPVSTDAYGNLQFYADPGIYILAFTVGGVPTTKTIEITPFYTDAAWNIVLDTTTATALSGDCRLSNASSASYVLTLPTPVIGARVKVIKTDSTAHTVTATSPSGVILGPGLGSGSASIILAGQGSFVELFGDGTNWHVAGGTPAVQMQAGNFNIVSDGGGGITVTYPYAFPNGVTSVVITANGVDGVAFYTITGAVTASGFSATAFDTGGHSVPSVNVTGNWIAVGY